MTNATKKFACEQCAFNGDTEEEYKKHWLEKHVEIPSHLDVYICEECGEEHEHEDSANVCCENDEERSEEGDDE